MTSLSVVGVGRIGGEVAFLSSFLGLADELVLYDVNQDLLRAQIGDLLHGIVDLEISTDPSAIRETDICIYAAGSPRDPTVRTRSDLLRVNGMVAESVSRYLSGFGGILVTVTNPVDILNYYLAEKCELDPARCIGFGGQLDSARFALELDPGKTEGERWVLGEHGDHQVPVFSRLYPLVPEPDREKILARLREASMEVIRGKGGTQYGPAAHIIQLLETVIEDSGNLIPVSCICQGEYGAMKCSVGVPAEVGWAGVLSIEEWTLDSWETRQMDEAIRFLQGLCRGLNI